MGRMGVHGGVHRAWGIGKGGCMEVRSWTWGPAVTRAWSSYQLCAGIETGTWAGVFGDTRVGFGIVSPIVSVTELTHHDEVRE